MGLVALWHVGSSWARARTCVPCIGRWILIYLFIYFWLCWVFVAARGLSLVAASGGYSSLRCVRFSLRWLHLLRNTGSRAQAQKLWHTDLVAPRHVGSSRTRDRTRVPCIGKWILFFFFKEPFLFLFYLFIYLFIFDCVGSSFLCEGFL